MEKKATAKALLEQEMATIKKTAKIPPLSKVTRAQIEVTKVTSKPEKQAPQEPLVVPLEENVNRLLADEEQARSVTDAINILRFIHLFIIVHIKSNNNIS